MSCLIYKELLGNFRIVLPVFNAIYGVLILRHLHTITNDTQIAKKCWHTDPQRTSSGKLQLVQSTLFISKFSQTLKSSWNLNITKALENLTFWYVESLQKFTCIDSELTQLQVVSDNKASFIPPNIQIIVISQINGYIFFQI